MKQSPCSGLNFVRRLPHAAGHDSRTGFEVGVGVVAPKHECDNGSSNASKPLMTVLY